MNKQGYYKKLFFIAALWNWITSVLFFFTYEYFFPVIGEKVPDSPLFLKQTLGLVFVFGLGYYWVSRDLSNTAIVKMGAIGKIFVFITLLYYAIFGDHVWITVLPGVVDFIFALFFIQFLIYRSTSEQAGMSAE